MSATSSSVARVPLVDRTAATGTVRAVLDQVHGAFGATPNMFRAVANSPAALQSMWGSFGALGGGRLSPLLGEQIAVAIANRILKEGAPAVADYKKFLSGGCSTDPISLLKIAGVDMSSPEPVNSALALFGELVDEIWRDFT